MQSWQYDIGDVLRIERKEQEVLARVADFVDQLDNTKPLYVNLRVAGGLRWSEAVVKVQPQHIIEHLPNWYKEQQEQWQTELSAHVDEQWAKMTEAQKRQIHEQAITLGLTQERRSPLDIMIDRACGRE